MQFIDFGRGSLGSITSVTGTVNTYASMTGTSGASTVTVTLSVAIGDTILLWQTQGTGAGNWELVRVQATGGGTSFTADRNLVNSYGSGAQAVKAAEYSGGTLSGITATDYDGTKGGAIFLLSNGTITQGGTVAVNGGAGVGAINTVGAIVGGFRGGNTVGKDSAANTGEGTALSSRNIVQTAQSSGGGGGGGMGSNNYAGAGGGGAYGATATNGQSGGGHDGVGGTSYGSANNSTAFLGGGGGAGACNNVDAYSGTGGSGGGFILIISKDFIYSSGVMSVNGGDGGRGDCNTLDNTQYGCGAGGGAGGSIIIKAQNITASGTSTNMTATAGVGGLGRRGNSADGTANGGSGSVGRIAWYYLISQSGASSPAVTTTQDPNLIDPASGTIANEI